MSKKLLLFILVFSSFFDTAFSSEIYLKNGDHISGEIVKEEKEQITFDSPILGIIPIQTKDIEKIKNIEREESKIHSPWTGEISAGYNSSRGNTENEKMTASIAIKRKIEKVDEFDLEGNIYYASANKKMDAQKWYSMTRYAKSFGEQKKWYWFGKGEIDHDKFADIYYRAVPCGGLGYWFIDKPLSKFLIECALGWEYTKYSTTTNPRSRTTIIPRIYLEKTFFDRLTVSTDFTYYSPISTLEEFRFHWDTAFSLEIFTNIHLRLSLIDDYNSDPDSDVKKNDLQIVSSAVYSF